MKLLDFSNELNSFFEKKDPKINNIKELLEETKNYFFESFEKIDNKQLANIKHCSSPKDRKKALKECLENRINDFNECILNSSVPNSSFESMVKLYNLFFTNDGKIKDKKMLTTIPRGHYFFRMRSSEEYRIYQKKDIFQIPTSKQNLISRQRFNETGFSCLYLAESLYAAWEEIRRANIETVNFALFVNKKRLNVLDLTIKTSYNNETDFFLAYLSLLVSDKVNDNDKYKFGYEIPVFFMKMLQNSISLITKVSIENDETVHGIKYMSSRRFDGKDIEFVNNNSIMCAYVFPPRNIDSTNEIDKWLIKTFWSSPVRTMFMYNIHGVLLKNVKNAITSDYNDTIFSMYEQLLKRENIKKIEN